MNAFFDIILRGLHRKYVDIFGSFLKTLACEKDPQKASDIIYQSLMSNAPCMICRYGSAEILCTANYIGKYKSPHNPFLYITDRIPQYWWNKLGMKQMESNAGFFPLTEGNIAKFAEMMIRDSRYIDILGSWRKEENLLINPSAVQLVHLLCLDPFHSERPWTYALRGKRVLVIHPFSDTIESQYKNNRHRIFTNPNILPDFELQTLKAIQSIGGKSDFGTWFDALQYMKDEIDKRDYDIALIGCGAYGFPLAGHIKRMGKKAVHLGGALQLLFGIKGKRWTNPDYGTRTLPFITKNYYNNLMNEFWVSPSDSERPTNANKVEGACYW